MSYCNSTLLIFSLIFSEVVLEILILYHTTYGGSDFLFLIKLMSGSNVPGIEQHVQAVCIRDSITTVAAESLYELVWLKLSIIVQNNSI